MLLWKQQPKSPYQEKKKKGKKALSSQSSLINNRNEGKACDYVNWEVRVPALKTESRKSV